MKLHNILLTAALFISATASFADPKIVDWPDYSWDGSVTVTDENENTSKTNKVLNITMFRMNGGSDGGWSYYAGGYVDKKGEGGIVTKELVAYGKLAGSDLKKLTDAEINALPLGEGSNLTAEEIAEIKDFSKEHGVFQFSVICELPIDEFGLMGTPGQSFENKNLVASIDNKSKKNSDHFISFSEDDNVLYYGKGQLTFNNGALFMVSVGDAPIYDKVITIGKPLPTPVITLLIALGFGAALVMYRNRKQVNA